VNALEKKGTYLIMSMISGMDSFLYSLTRQRVKRRKERMGWMEWKHRLKGRRRAEQE